MYYLFVGCFRGDGRQIADLAHNADDIYKEALLVMPYGYEQRPGHTAKRVLLDLLKAPDRHEVELDSGDIRSIRAL